MQESDFAVHGDYANNLVTPREERIVYRCFEKKERPAIEELDIAIGDMYYHLDRRRYCVIAQVGSDNIVYAYQMATGNITEDRTSIGMFLSCMRLLERGDTAYLHSFLVRPQVHDRKPLSKFDIFGFFKNNTKIKRKGEGRCLMFAKEDIAREYPWYKL